MKKQFNKINNKWYEVNEKNEYILISDDELIEDLEINLILQDKELAGEEIMENVTLADFTKSFLARLRKSKFIKELESQGINL